MRAGDEPPSIVVASANPGKTREIAKLLAGQPVRVRALAEDESVVFPEESLDYRDNAIAKARAVVEQLGLCAIADDSGLEVDALGGRPGPLSARYGGPGLDDAGRVARLLAELGDRPDPERGARFVCHAAFAAPDGQVETAEGFCAGQILDAPRGQGGFGYDPIFRPDGHDRAMAELSADEKDALSHRGRAIRLLLPGIRAVLGLDPEDITGR